MEGRRCGGIGSFSPISKFSSLFVVTVFAMVVVIAAPDVVVVAVAVVVVGGSYSKASIQIITGFGHFQSSPNTSQNLPKRKEGELAFGYL